MEWAARELVSVARLLVAKKRPETFVEQVFFDIKENAKEQVDQQAQNALVKIRNTIGKFLVSGGAEVGDVVPKLGKFKGHVYMAACKITVKVASEQVARQIEKALQNKFSPKFKLKKFESGIAEFNTRR